MSIYQNLSSAENCAKATDAIRSILSREGFGDVTVSETKAETNNNSVSPIENNEIDPMESQSLQAIADRINAKDASAKVCMDF